MNKISLLIIMSLCLSPLLSYSSTSPLSKNVEIIEYSNQSNKDKELSKKIVGVWERGDEKSCIKIFSEYMSNGIKRTTMVTCKNVIAYEAKWIVFDGYLYEEVTKTILDDKDKNIFIGAKDKDKDKLISVSSNEIKLYNNDIGDVTYKRIYQTKYSSADAVFNDLFHEENSQTYVVWMPAEFLTEVMYPIAKKKGDQEVLEKARGKIGNYLVFAMYKATTLYDFNHMIESKKIDKNILEKNIFLKINDGNKILPTDVNSVPSDVLNFMKILHKSINAMFDAAKKPYQTDLYIFLSPEKINFDQKFNMTMLVDGSEFKWFFPLKSLLHNEVKPLINEKFPGNYIYNPYSGEKLN